MTHPSQQAPDDGLRGQVFKITNECQPVFPCEILKAATDQRGVLAYDANDIRSYPEYIYWRTVPIVPPPSQPAPVAVGGERTVDGVGHKTTYQPQHMWSDGEFENWTDLGLPTQSKRNAEERMIMFRKVHPTTQTRYLRISSTIGVCDLDNEPAPLSAIAPVLEGKAEAELKQRLDYIHEIVCEKSNNGCDLELGTTAFKSVQRWADWRTATVAPVTPPVSTSAEKCAREIYHMQMPSMSCYAHIEDCTEASVAKIASVLARHFNGQGEDSK